MTTLTHDSERATPAARTVGGLALALTSAVCFGLSGSVARGLLDSGWSAGSAVILRLMLAAAVLLPVALVTLRGRWHLLRAAWRTVVVYGLAAMMLAQFAFFRAVEYLPVGLALLIEYTAPVAVVLWMWLRHGQRPTALTGLGAAIAGIGLLLLLDVLAGGSVSLVGVGWGLLAMVGAATYFVVSGDDRNGLPPLVLATGGLIVGSVALLVLGLVGLVPLRAGTADATYAVGQVAWWVPILVLGLVTAAAAYVTGIAATRRLGSRLASFVALSEVVAALLFAWLLLAELPGPVQLLGGVVLIGGVVVVKLGERRGPAAPPVLATPHG